MSLSQSPHKFRAPREPNCSKDYKSNPRPYWYGVKINPSITAKDCKRILDLMDDTKNDVEVTINTAPKAIAKPYTFPRSSYFNSPQKTSSKSSQSSIRLKPLPIKSSVSSSNHFVSDFSNVPSTSRSTSQYDTVGRAFQVVYGKYKPYKKKKEWTFDGFLETSKNGVVLIDCDGKIIGRLEKGSEPKQYKIYDHIVFGSYECEIQDEIEYQTFKSGAFFATDL